MEHTWYPQTHGLKLTSEGSSSSIHNGHSGSSCEFERLRSQPDIHDVCDCDQADHRGVGSAVDWRLSMRIRKYGQEKVAEVDPVSSRRGLRLMRKVFAGSLRDGCNRGIDETTEISRNTLHQSLRRISMVIEQQRKKLTSSSLQTTSCKFLKTSLLTPAAEPPTTPDPDAANELDNPVVLP